MHKYLFCLGLCVFFACGCVTERTDTPNDGVAYLDREIKKIVDRLPYQTGMDLYRDLNHLTAFEEFAIEPMRECLSHENSKVRASAALVLGQLRAKEALGDLLKVTKDSNRWVRLEAARAVLEVGAWDSVPMLLECLDDPDPQIRILGSEILERKTGQNLGYDPQAPPAERSAAARRWNQWWEEMQDDPGLEGNLASR